MRRASSLLLACFALLAPAVYAQHCKGTLYLTIDTGWMNHAEWIASTLNKHNVKATFFVANEKTTRGDMSMDPSWAPFWKSLVADGHAFGSHTFRHHYFRGDVAGGKVAYVGKNGKRELLDRAGDDGVRRRRLPPLVDGP